MFYMYMCVQSLIRCSSHKETHTDQPKKKLLFRISSRNTPGATFFFFFFAEKNKNHLFCRGFSSRNVAVKLRESSRRNSAAYRGDTPRDFAEKLREISRWVPKDLRFLHADNEDSDQTEKLNKCPALYESILDGS